MTTPANWWESFFEGLIVDFWRAAIPADATKSEADFYERSLVLDPGARVLDVPCGDGRLSLELARRGYQLTGVDISRDFLAAARALSLQERLSIEWRRSDMRDLPWTERFDGAFCAGSSFGFLGDEGDAAFCDAVFRALKPGARFAIDAVKAAEVVLPQFRERHELEVADIRFAAENRYDHETGSIDNVYTITRGDERETRRARHRIYTYSQVAAMLRSSGFVSIEGFASLRGEPFRLGAARLILLTRKPK